MTRLVLGNIDASDTGRGWIAPTTVQPKFATFFNGCSAGLNMADQGQDAIECGAPQLVAGMRHEHLPHAVFQGGRDYLRTTVPVPREGTFFSIARAPDLHWTESDKPHQIALIGTSSGHQLALSLTASTGGIGYVHSRIPEHHPSGWDTAPRRSTELTDWALYALRYQVTGSEVIGMVKAYTSDMVSEHHGQPSPDLPPVWLEIGSQGSFADGVLQGVSHQAAAMIWDIALPDNEMDAVAACLRRWCARYGVTV